MCCRYTTTPDCRSGVCVSIGLRSSCCSSCSVVALRVELSTTRLSAVFGQPALDYLVPTSSSIQSGWQDSNLRLRAPKARGFAATLHPVESERATNPAWGRSVPEPPISWPPTRRDTQASLRSVTSSPCGSRTQPARLERPMTSPEVERAVFGAHAERQVGRAVLESASPGFQPAR